MKRVWVDCLVEDRRTPSIFVSQIGFEVANHSYDMTNHTIAHTAPSMYYCTHTITI